MVTSKDFEEPSVKGDGFLIIDDIRLENFGDPSTPVKNNDFEDWDVQNISHPAEWYTTDIYLYETVGIIPPLPLVSESNDAFEGNKALLLSNRQFGQDILPGLAMTGSLDAFLVPTFPMNLRKEYFTGKYKFNSTEDTARILVRLFKNGFPIAIGLQDIPPSQDDAYRTFAFRINYTVQTSPDSASIMIACADGENPRNGNSSLLVDDLQFADSILSIENVASPDFSMYPNPTQGDIYFNENIEEIEIWNIHGQKLEQFKHTNHININHLPNQIYLIKTLHNNKLWTQRIIKQ